MNSEEERFNKSMFINIINLFMDFKNFFLLLLQALSFSLLYSDRSLDIVCKDKKEFETWTMGLKVQTTRFETMKLS